MAAPLTRRVVLLGSAGLVAACTSVDKAPADPSSAAAPTPTSSSSFSSSFSSAVPAPTGPTGSPLPPTTPWQPDPGDIEPAAKLAAVRHLESTASATHAVQVVFAQYGGLLDASASVLVVCREWQVGPSGTVQEGGSTYDVRVSRSGSAWQVTGTTPSQPGAPSGALSATGRAVLATDRIALPPAGRADVSSGQVHDSVLAGMLTLAEAFEIGVSVVRTGHPLLVFGTDRASDHPQGRAFDTYRIDGQLVVDPATPKALVTDFMRAAASAGLQRRRPLSFGVRAPVLSRPDAPRPRPRGFSLVNEAESVPASAPRKHVVRAYRRAVSGLFRTFSWELRSCGLHGHATYAPTEVALAERLQADTTAGTAWRCLRCGAYVPGDPRGSGPADEAPHVRRGRAVRDAFILRLLALERLVRGLALVALAYGLWRFDGARESLQKVFDSYLPALQPLADQLGVDLNETGPVSAVEKLLAISASTLLLVTLGVLAYGLLELTEALGLWLLRRWGEYVAVVGTAIFLPLEVHEILAKVTWLRVAAFAINVFAVVYLLWSKRLFGLRGGYAAYEAERRTGSLLDVEAAALNTAARARQPMATKPQ